MTLNTYTSALARRRCALLGWHLSKLVGWEGQVLARSPTRSAQTSEGWARAQIKEGKKANFNARCGTPAPDATHCRALRLDGNCRRLSGHFLSIC